VIRISPTELHVSDPDFYNTLYAGGSQRRHKDSFVLQGFFTPTAGFATQDHDIHRMRRMALNPFFSKQAVQRLEPMIQGKIDLLCKRLQEMTRQGQVLDIEVAIMALTTDIISEYSFGYSYHALEQEDLAASWTTSFREAMGSSMLFRYFPSVGKVMTGLPLWLVKIVSPSILPAATIMSVSQ
jgi:cytochrome P450